MRTNVNIELTDVERDQLANIIDDKVTKRLATRADINELLKNYLVDLLASPSEPRKPTTPAPMARKKQPDNNVDPEDRVALEGKPESYIRGWNNVKHRQRRA